MKQRQPKTTPTAPRFTYTPLFRSHSRGSPVSIQMGTTPTAPSPPTLKENDMRLSRVRQPNKIVTAAAATMLCIALAATAQAAGSGMPWEEPLQQVLESVQGPVAKIVAVKIGRAHV